MMRDLFAALLLATAAQGQVQVHAGVEAGVPLTNTPPAQVRSHRQEMASSSLTHFLRTPRGY